MNTTYIVPNTTKKIICIYCNKNVDCIRWNSSYLSTYKCEKCWNKFMKKNKPN